MDGGHQALHDAELVIQHLGDGGQAVGGAGGVGYERHIRGVLAVVDAHDEHGRIVLGGGAHDHVLGASVNVTLAQLLGQVLAGALANILRTHGSPGNVLDLHSGKDRILLAVDHQGAVLGGDLAGELAVHAVILQHVGHILGVHEGIVQADDLYIVMSQGGAEDEAANAAEAIDANLGFHIGKTPFTKSDAPAARRQNVCVNVF